MNAQYKLTSLILTLSILFFSCSNNSPKVVAEKFLLSVARADLEEAKNYCDSNTKELLDQAQYLNMVPDSVKAEGRKLKINVVDVKENGDKAVVRYTTSKLNEEQIISLVKVNGNWQVQLDKAQSFEDEQPMLTDSNEIGSDTSSTNHNQLDSPQVSPKDTLSH